MEIERHGGPLGSFRVQTFFYSNFYCSFVEGDLATMIGFEAAKGVGTVFFQMGHSRPLFHLFLSFIQTVNSK